jgi:hypothetical protein
MVRPIPAHFMRGEKKNAPVDELIMETNNKMAQQIKEVNE